MKEEKELAELELYLTEIGDTALLDWYRKQDSATQLKLALVWEHGMKYRASKFAAMIRTRWLSSIFYRLTLFFL